MITKQQALDARHGQTFHYTGGTNKCTRDVGPRGGVKEHITAFRVTGQCKTWVTRPNDFRLPIQWGIYARSGAGYIDQDNAVFFHAPADCPLLVAEAAEV